MPKVLRLAVLVSGGGTTLQALMDAEATGELPAEIVLVVSSRREAFALERARRRRIPALVLRPRDFPSARLHDEALVKALTDAHPDLVILAGYLSVVGEATIAAFKGRVMNIHPSLLPAFGGKGLYGRRVHQQVLDYGCKVTGATVMFVEAELDAGPIILQAAVPVHEDDTCDTLAARVGDVERCLYPVAIKLYAEGRLRPVGRKVTIL